MGEFYNYEGSSRIDWDLNIYQDPTGDTEFWFIDPYVCEGGDHYQYETNGTPFMLTMSEVYAIMNKDEYFEGQEDAWYGMDGFLKDYWERLSDRVKFFLESLPKYTEDLDRSVLR
jgi:hypothetical protein